MWPPFLAGCRSCNIQQQSISPKRRYTFRPGGGDCPRRVGYALDMFIVASDDGLLTSVQDTGFQARSTYLAVRHGSLEFGIKAIGARLVRNTRQFKLSSVLFIFFLLHNAS
ncbi:hypothetical protein GMOD_00006203 [Pyrenophora seminiperda CCB06]|uniref:Uncharacterized protein n=1 Tax=Pyrenophora seminiperda CCB06 TaxID=1302712 RepID=A0A3M7M4J4_9PLEO|nr:hypothetical protein GMOD_00006203 [Pyrenophora seminiperda CCB06]